MKPAGAMHYGTVAALVGTATLAIHEIAEPTTRAAAALCALIVAWIVGLTRDAPPWSRRRRDCDGSEPPSS